MEVDISSHEEREGSKFTYRVPSQGLTKVLVTMLWINVGVSVFIGLSDFMEWKMLTGKFSEAQAIANDNRQMLLAFAGLIYCIALAFIFLKWIYQANKNCHHFGAEGMKFSPGWSVGFYFIPILNLYKPCQAMREIWQVSRNPGDWENQPKTKLLGLWWTLLVLSIFLDFMIFRMPLESVEDFITFSKLAVFYDIIHVAVTIVAIILVTKIAQAQERFQESDKALVAVNKELGGLFKRDKSESTEDRSDSDRDVTADRSKKTDQIKEADPIKKADQNNSSHRPPELTVLGIIATILILVFTPLGDTHVMPIFTNISDFIRGRIGLEPSKPHFEGWAEEGSYEDRADTLDYPQDAASGFASQHIEPSLSNSIGLSAAELQTVTGNVFEEGPRYICYPVDYEPPSRPGVYKFVGVYTLSGTIQEVKVYMLNEEKF